MPVIMKNLTVTDERADRNCRKSLLIKSRTKNFLSAMAITYQGDNYIPHTRNKSTKTKLCSRCEFLGCDCRLVKKEILGCSCIRRAKILHSKIRGEQNEEQRRSC